MDRRGCPAEGVNKGMRTEGEKGEKQKDLKMDRRGCPEEGLNKGTWTAGEDEKLIEYVKAHGEGRWPKAAKAAGLKRCGKSCRLRWMNYLRPDVKRGNISQDEEDLIIRLHRLLGNRWSLIAGRLPSRTDNEIKNYWNATISKKLGSLQKKSVKKLHHQPSVNLAAEAPDTGTGEDRLNTGHMMSAKNCTSNPECPSKEDWTWTLDDFELGMDFNFGDLMGFAELADIDVNAGSEDTYRNNVAGDNSTSRVQNSDDQGQRQSTDFQSMTSLFEPMIAGEDWLLDRDGWGFAPVAEDYRVP